MYFEEKNYDRMVDILKPMHEQLRKGPESMNEVTFY